MTVIITLTTAGADTGPFNLFSDANGYTIAFALGVTKQQLLDGYPSDLVPDGTTTIRVQSVNSLCNNYIDLLTGITTTTTTTTTEPVATYCVNWTAENEGNIKMSTQGYIDFTEILAGRTIQYSPVSAGTITGYVIAGMPPFTCSIPMIFTTTQAQWNTDTLPVETDKVLTSLIYTVEVVFNDASEYLITDGQTNAVVTPGIQLTSSYNDCPITTTTTSSTSSTTSSTSTTTSTTTAPPILIPITLGFFADNSLEACSRFTSSPITKYIFEDNIDFFNALELYDDVNGTTLSPAGIYSDGTLYRTWNGTIFTGAEGTCNI